MLAKAIVAFLALPGVVAFLLPGALLLATNRINLAQPAGLAALAFGLVGLLWCVRDFYVAGKGTLAPWAPPERLVVVGLYRYCRNPMYASVGVLLLGWAVSFASPVLFAYSLFVAIAFHVRVVLREELWLERMHGQAWQEYCASVPRWFYLRPKNAP